MTKALDYHNYLQLDKLLNAQQMESAKHGNPSHDEMLFIIVHQAYELWFKQILHEIDDIRSTFDQATLSDTAIYRIVSRLQRIVKILNLMINQVKIIETITPMDFLDFRDFLGPSSGLQSFQFRLLEIKLGVRYEINTPFYSRLETSQQQTIKEVMNQASLSTLVERWLERTPFLATQHFSFLDNYKKAVQTMLDTDKEKIMQNNLLSDAEKQARLQQIKQTEMSYNAFLDDKLYNELLERGECQMSRLAVSAALLIYIYRDQPIFQLPFMLLSGLVEIDELLTSWRHAHILMVRRMIGQRMGTGGTSGQQYLEHAMKSRKIFGDLINLATFLVRHSEMPPLPADVKQQLGFQYSV